MSLAFACACAFACAFAPSFVFGAVALRQLFTGLEVETLGQRIPVRIDADDGNVRHRQKNPTLLPEILVDRDRFRVVVLTDMHRADVKGRKVEVPALERVDNRHAARPRRDAT